VEEILTLDAGRKKTQKKLDTKLAEVNRLSKAIGEWMKAGLKEAAQSAKEQSIHLKEEIKELENELKSTEETLQTLLVQLPNLPHESVPEGKSAADNLVEATGGTMPSLPEKALPHWDLAKKYDLIDFELGVKITGAGFPVYKGKGARLQRALINFFLDEARQAGYVEIQPPYVVNAAPIWHRSAPRYGKSNYHDEVDDLYLIPTPKYREPIYFGRDTREKELPLKYCANSACFAVKQILCQRCQD
jgi:seryl-tRNA synthetase